MEDKEKKEEMNLDISVQELIARLAEDESWEPDPEYRKKAIGMLMQKLSSC